MRVLVTGANGFVGRALCLNLKQQGYLVRRVSRIASAQCEGVENTIVGPIDGMTNWLPALSHVDVVVHLAARVHVMSDTTVDPLMEYRNVNVKGCLNLARQAAAAGVKRLIFLSSIKVNGEITQPGHPFTADDVPAPQEPYGISKLEAEQGLRAIAVETELAVVVIRSPLVYGPGVGANFNAMLKAVASGVPLPLGAIDNRRSLVALDNLVNLITICLEHPKAVNQIFLVSDGEDLSTKELIGRVAKAMGKPARLFSVPVQLLKIGGALTHRQSAVRRLCESLQVDISKTTAFLGWTPPITVDEGIRRVLVNWRR